AACKPTHPRRSLDATASNGRSLRQTIGSIGPPRPGSSCRMTCLPRDEPADFSNSSSVGGAHNHSINILTPLGTTRSAHPRRLDFNLLGPLVLGQPSDDPVAPQ